MPKGHPSTRILGDERMGSGVVVERRGLILTVNYVVMGAQTVEVGLLKGRRTRAEVVAQDFEVGLAVLRVKRQGLPAALLAPTGALERGDPVIAIASTGAQERRRQRRPRDLPRRVRGVLGVPARPRHRLQRAAIPASGAAGSSR